MSRRTIRAYDVGTALDGIRQTAGGRRRARFTGLLHHIYAVERLEQAYLAVKRDAAGVDGQTWAGYGQDLEANLLDLSDRLARGGYRPQPVKRVYIDKADGSKRPLTVPALASRTKFTLRMLTPTATASGALCALFDGVQDFDRCALDIDLWVEQWRGRHARGDVIAVRYADDWVAGFQFRVDAERFKRAVEQRLGQFGLKLHPDKTRLIEFGRFARDNQRRREQGKPDTFDFLGFTHCCGKTRKGKFMVLRLTSATRLRAKLLAVKTELRRRTHHPIAEQGQYLRSVVVGHGRYFAVPCNGARVQAFHFQVGRLWHRTLCRRSQAKHMSWKRMHKIVAHWLPSPRMCHPYPGQRLIVTTQDRSRMR